MSSSHPTKRSHNTLEAERPPSKRRIRSCEACRRLKTRCEIQGNASVCHRCKVLKLECSLEAILGPASESPKAVEASNSQSCECQDRLGALENSLYEMKNLLEKRLPEPEATSPRSTRKSVTGSSYPDARTPPKLPLLSPQTSLPLAADRNSRTAPMSLIRDMEQHILGPELESLSSDQSEDIVAKGLITEEMTRTLLAGFTQLSRRWLFMRSNPMSIRQISPLLFASCVLAGLHINPSLHGTNVHQALYRHVSGLISKSMLVTPLSLETIQAMLIFSMWNLVPNKDTEHIDTWLLSGMAAMHGMLAINFEQLVQVPKHGRVDSKSREAIRTWNLICLVHLQFSVGTGRPPVVWYQYLKQCESILSLPSYDSRDQLVAAGVRLYDSLCRLVNSDVVQTDSLIWEEIDEWKAGCGQIFDLDSSKPLRFAYSCSYLILTRRTLKHLSETTSLSSNPSSLDSTLFIDLAAHHSHLILTLFVATSEMTSFVRPAYENLLCSYAMVTLSEFASYLTSITATLDLMEKAYSHVQLGGKAEPVGRWALNVLRKFSFDEQKVPEAAVQQTSSETVSFGINDSGGGGESGGIGSNGFLNGGLDMANWGTDTLLEQEFPSLEEMFLGF